MISNKPFVITLVGAESSGKTTMANHIASAFHCPVIYEHARDYLSKLNRPYDINDLEAIARKEWQELQFFLNNEQTFYGPSTQAQHSPLPESINKILGQLDTKKQFLVVDGGLLTIRLWARIKFKRTIEFVEKALTDDPTDLYLLFRPLPDWEPDVFREAPDLTDRSWIYNQYLAELVATGKKFQIISNRK